MEKKKEEGGEEERKKTSSFNRKTSSHNHNHVIITVFLMDAQAVNKYHINYKISRIYRPLYNLSNRRWVLDAKLKFMTKACKTSNLNVDVQPLLLETKLFNLKKIQLTAQWANFTNYGRGIKNSYFYSLSSYSTSLLPFTPPLSMVQ